jgi:thiol:disulfide interchange protein DsbC
MLKGAAPTAKACETPIDRIIQVAQKHSVSGTPTLIFADGSVAPGMIPAEMIEKRLGAMPIK